MNAATQDLVARNAKLAFRRGRELYQRSPFYRRLGEEEDAAQEATLGLIEAAERYDPRRGALSTLAYLRIGHHLRKAASHAGLVSVPDGTVAASWRKGQHLSDKTRHRLANALMGTFDLPPETVPSSASGDDKPEEDELAALVAALEQLPSREAQALRWLYGIGGEAPCNCPEIGRRMGVCRWAAHLMIRRGLVRLRRLLGVES